MTAAEHTKCRALLSARPARRLWSCVRQPGPARAYSMDRDAAVPTAVLSAMVFAMKRCGLSQGYLGPEEVPALHPELNSPPASPPEGAGTDLPVKPRRG